MFVCVCVIERSGQAIPPLLTPPFLLCVFVVAESPSPPSSLAACEDEEGEGGAAVRDALEERSMRSYLSTVP